MKPRAKWLHEELLNTKPGRHQDKRRKEKEREITEEMRAARNFRRRKSELED